jgi:F420-dependent oxidoreductase-like protein
LVLLSGDVKLSKVNFCVFLPFYAFQNALDSSAASSFNQVKDVVLECERLSYHSVWLDDHLMFGRMPILECWTTLAALSAVTTSIRLGAMVTSIGFRNPALLAKMAATVDGISGGRLEFGVGSGIQPEEHQAYGLSFPGVKVRTERMKEAVEIIKSMWTKENTSYAGKHYKVTNAFCEPKPVQRPHPPITIGGSGEDFTLKVTAQYADRCDFGYLPSLEKFEHKLTVLDDYCKKIGRDIKTVEKTCWPAGQVIIALDEVAVAEAVQRVKPANISREDFKKVCLAGTPDECAVKLQPYLDLGVTHFMLYFGEIPDPKGLRVFAETVAKKLT